MKIDSSLFLPTSISSETLQFNAELESQMDAMPDMWSHPIDVVRKARAEGNGTFPLEKPDESAEWLEASFDGQSVRCRLFRHKEKSSRGTYFHIHGGGWTVGSATAHDERLREISDRCGLHVLSVEYRLAPENPYPDGPDDCLTAARWLLEENHDFLRIYSGPYSCLGEGPILTLTGGHEKHKEWTLDTNEINIVFRSDETLGLNGFLISLEAVGIDS